MRKSRLNLFKSTSMLISVLGVVMIIATIVVAAYIGFSAVSNGITTGVSSGNQYDQLSELKSNYTQLESKFNSTANNYVSDTTKYDNTRLEITRASSDIDDVDSALSAGKSSDEVNSRITTARDQLKVANQALDNLTANS